MVHKRDWRTLWRRCLCGRRAPCPPDATTDEPPVPPPIRPTGRRGPFPHGMAPTMSPAYDDPYPLGDLPHPPGDRPCPPGDRPDPGGRRRGTSDTLRTWTHRRAGGLTAARAFPSFPRRHDDGVAR